ncbi:MAG: hypothetical protein P1V51_09785 [Deltaproteobacteria bacterium]|nr:hypothetical protein [Deltaproteobacteria bacterium]
MSSLPIRSGLLLILPFLLLSGGCFGAVDDSDSRDGSSPDAYLEIRTGVGVDYPLTANPSSPFRPRRWNGTVHYCLTP